MHRSTVIVLLLALTVFILSGARAQIDGTGPIPGIQKPSSDGPNVPSEMRRSMEKKANQQRQEQLKKDTEKLLKLSTELKAYVDKTNENVMSLDVIKKAEEIEKLARSVKTKMRGDQYGTVPDIP